MIEKAMKNKKWINDIAKLRIGIEIANILSVFNIKTDRE